MNYSGPTVMPDYNQRCADLSQDRCDREYDPAGKDELRKLCRVLREELLNLGHSPDEVDVRVMEFRADYDTKGGKQ